jgi:periplasmic divalent cation tolerance protein
MTSTDAIVVLTTLASQEEAARFVSTLVERRLVACGTILPGARSIYRWEGKVTDESECLVLLKSRQARVAEIEQTFGELHPYSVPEMLVIPVAAGLPRYLDWIAGQTATASV